MTGLLTSWLAAALAIAPADADTVRYTYLIQGNRAGEQIVVSERPGTFRVHFAYNDRGRGPNLQAAIQLNSVGIPVQIDTRGNDYLKSQVHETFSWERGEARWRNPAESGEQVVSGSVFYVSMHATPFETALLARALLTAPAHRMTLLPAGEAALETLAELDVEAGGQRRRLQQYAIGGLGLLPTRVWLDQSGQFFASASMWESTILEGWESTLPALLEAERRASEEHLERIASEIRDRPAVPAAFVDVNLFEAGSATTRSGMTVVVEGNRIAMVGPTGSFPLPGAVREIDGRGRTLLPGLFDMHAHAGDADGMLNLAAGVTTVRDLANETEPLLQRKAGWDSLTTLGPRVILAGFMDGPGPYAGPTRVLVDTAEEIRDAVEMYAALGHEQIKMYSSIDTALVSTIVEEAHARGMRVSGHIPAFMLAEDAVRAGFDEIQHANMLFLNFLGDTLDTRTPVRFTAVAAHAASLDLTSDSVRAFVDLLLEHDVVVDPTLSIFEQMFKSRAGRVLPGERETVDRLPPLLRRTYLGGGLPVPESMDATYRASHDAMMAFVRVLHEAGVRIVPGTDALAGFALHRELELYVEAGIPAPEVLRLATAGAAAVAGREGDVGQVRPGMVADLVLVRGDPTANISDIRRVEWTMKDGVLFESSAMYRSLGVRPWQEMVN